MGLDSGEADSRGMEHETNPWIHNIVHPLRLWTLAHHQAMAIARINATTIAQRLPIATNV